MTSPLRVLSLRVRFSVLSLICSRFIALMMERLARPQRASHPRPRPARSRYACSSFRRFACLAMTIVMFLQVPASPHVSHPVVEAVSAKAINSWHEGRFWWHSSGWAARMERFRNEFLPLIGATPQRRGWDGRGAPRRSRPYPQEVETQQDREQRVARIKIFPGDVEIKTGEQVVFNAVAFDQDGNAVNGLEVKWTGLHEEKKYPITILHGTFVSGVPGKFFVMAEIAGHKERVKIIVTGETRRPNLRSRSEALKSSRESRRIGSLRAPNSGDQKRIARRSKQARMPALPGTTPPGLRAASAPMAARPALQIQGEDTTGWNSLNIDTADNVGGERGVMAGRAIDGGFGSANFQFAAPAVVSDGRGIDLTMLLNYNSRLWHKAGSEITFDIDREEMPGPGWTLGFGKIVMAGDSYMLIDGDGTRHSYEGTLRGNFPAPATSLQTFEARTTDGTFINYYAEGYKPQFDNSGGKNMIVAWAVMPNGTKIEYGARANYAMYPIKITDKHGNFINITYLNNEGPKIQTIVDTQGRFSEFHYDVSGLLTAITVPGLGGGSRVAVRLQYQELRLSDAGDNFGFAGGLTTKVRQDTIHVVKAIYYPGTNTGYWFGDGDSYSPYGMIRKVRECRGMTFDNAPLDQQGNIGAGVMSREMVYDYPESGGSFSDMPRYSKVTEDWAGRVTASAPETKFSVVDNGGLRTTTIKRHDDAELTQITDNNPSSPTYGMLLEDALYQDDSHSVVLSRSKAFWEIGAYNSPRPWRIETYDERGRMTATTYSYDPAYGSLYNSVTDARVLGYNGELLRRMRTEYLNNSNYNGFLQNSGTLWWKEFGPPSGGPNWRGQHIFDLVSVTEVYAGDDVTRLSRAEYQYDGSGLTDNPGIIQYNSWYNPHTPPQEVCGWVPDMNDPDCANPGCTLQECNGTCDSVYVCNNIQQFDPLTLFRGNVTQIKSYADAVSLDQATAVVETRTYDIAGNMRAQSSSCCEQTTITCTTATQYAWPESLTSGSPSVTSKQNTSSAVYDYNTGLVLISTDVNDRDLEIEYDPNTLRPVLEDLPTGAYLSHVYDDLNLKVEDHVYEAWPSGPLASRSDKYLDGLGRVIKEVAFAKNNMRDVVETKFDNMGRVWQQSRPYRANDELEPQETLQWSAVTYDLLNRPIQTTSPDMMSIVTRDYNPSPDPPGSSGLPGQTVKVTDPWGRERWARSDALGRMVEVAEPNPGGNGTLSSGALFTTYTYDAVDRLVLVNQGAQTRSFRYDSLGRMTHQKLAERDAALNFDGNWVGAGQWSDVFTYDKRSNLTQHVDARGVKTIFKYKDAGGVDDPLNRLLEVQYDKNGSPSHLIDNIPVAPNVSYAYMTTTPGDKMRVQNVDFGIGNETMSYDSEGRLSQVVQTFTGRESYPLITNYIWDSLDRLKESTYPQPYGAGEIRKKVEPAYEVASRLESLKFDGATYASEPVYNAASQTTSLKVGSQMTESYEYDQKTGLLTNQKVIRGASDTLVDLKYNYTLNNDANNNGPKTGQLTGMTDLKNQARNRAYEYDKLGRLIKVKGGVNAFNTPNWHQTYSYDRYGNRSLVQHTDLGMAPVKPGSQSRSDLISKIGPGASGAANRIFSADNPLAALSINKGYGSINADFSESDNNGTRMRGGPRAPAEEYGYAPSANGVGGKLLAEHPAGNAPSAPPKEYRNRTGLPVVTAQGGGVITVNPSAYQGSVTDISNTGHGSTSTVASAMDIQLDPPQNITQLRSASWSSFQGGPSGGIIGLKLKFDWAASGNVDAVVEVGSSASATINFDVEYSIDGGSTWTNALSRSKVVSQVGPGSKTDGISDGGSVEVVLSPSQNISLVQVRDSMRANAKANASNSLHAYAESNANIAPSVSSIRLEVQVETVAPVISNVAAGGITATGATITWNTDENSDSQVEYGPTTAYGQSTTLAPALVTAHSQGLSGLASGTLYHYRVKSKDAAGNLAVSGDFSFTTPDITAPVISNVAAGSITATSATITWNTNENSDSQVEYGVDTGYGLWAPMTPNPTPVTAHSQGLSGLASGTLYHYRVKSKDAAGNLAVSGDFSFTTNTDATAPVISNVASGSITASSATITWNTNENSDSQVEYGVDTGYGLSAPTTPPPVYVTGHSQVLSGLTAGTVYHYRVKSKDAAGNLAVSGDFTFTTSQSGSVPLDGLASLSYNGANNRINTSGFEYDPAGNQTRAVINASGTQQQYRYDCAGRLAQVLDGGGNVLSTYSYGAGNQRLKSVEGGVTKYFAWAGGKIIAEYEASGANALIWKTSYVYLGGRLLATTSGAGGTETRFHHPDQLGTRLVTSTDGTVVTEQLSMPFGTTLPFTQTYGGENSFQHPTLSNPSKKRFTSYDRSDATGLDYAVNRFYSPQQGRFTQVDPIGMGAASLSDPQSLNMYAYCGNDPINHVDPYGLFIPRIIIDGVRSVGGIIIPRMVLIVISEVFIRVRGGSSRSGARTPPTFGKPPSITLGGILGGILSKIPIGIGVKIDPRTPPLVHGLAALDDVVTWEWSGVGALMRFLQGIGGGKKARKRPCPTGRQLAGDPEVRKALDEAFTDSDNDNKAHMHEEGGYIWRNSLTGRISVTRVASGPHAHAGQMSLPALRGDIEPSPPTSDDVLVGWFHTHPGEYGDPITAYGDPGVYTGQIYGWPAETSPGDRSVARSLRAPGLIRYQDTRGNSRIRVFGPARSPRC